MQNMERCQFDQGQSISVEYTYTLKSVVILELFVWWGLLLLQWYDSGNIFSSFRLLKEEPDYSGKKKNSELMGLDL